MFAHVSIPDLVNWLTALYLVLLIAHKGWNMYRQLQSGKERDESGE